MPNYATTEKVLIHDKDWVSFSESYMLRGNIIIPPKVEPKTFGFDFHMI